MSYLKYLISLCCFLILFNCGEVQKTIFSDINITSENNAIVEVNIPHADGNKVISNQINSTIQKTIISNLHIGNPDDITSTSVKESISAFNNEYNGFKTKFPDSAQIWEAQIDGEIMHHSTEIISVALTSYINTGGAHGALNISFLNFNSVTGEVIKNNQLFNDQEAFKKLAEPYFKNATKDKSLLLENDQFKLPENIGYSEEGVIFLYNIFEIAPYSTGIIEFAIPFEDVESYLVFNSL